ncbi:MAG: hypothetical protein ACRECL_06675 [Bradyrhizobium sp.]
MNPPAGSFIKPGTSGAKNHSWLLPTREKPIAGKIAARAMRAPAGATSCACTDSTAALNSEGAAKPSADALIRKSRQFMKRPLQSAIGYCSLHRITVENSLN